jgi:acetyl-CoA carboxylase carboxyl transferase subunit alpha
LTRWETAPIAPAMASYLEFEKPVAELRARIDELRESSGEGDADIAAEISKLDAKADRMLAELYAKLSPWEKTKVARHPERPHFKHYAARLFTDFLPLAGDRAISDDLAILGGFATFRGRKVMVMGHEKGEDTASRLRHNFGMAMPEGYRKAVRLVELADRFALPIITLVDTSGAFPGIEGEERGQAVAIARSTEAFINARVPVVAAIVGEGGSGGAVALAGGNRVLMSEHAVYSVITPEGCASILWRTADKASDAAAAMRVTSADLLKLGVIDTIVKEPMGGAHRAHAEAIDTLGNELESALSALDGISADTLRADRRAKFLAMGRL